MRRFGRFSKQNHSRCEVGYKSETRARELSTPRDDCANERWMDAGRYSKVRPGAEGGTAKSLASDVLPEDREVGIRLRSGGKRLRQRRRD